MTTRHDKLFEAYVKDLQEVKVSVEHWWSNLLDSEQKVTGDRNEALHRLKQRWRSGPSGHPRVIAVVRKYFLACEALNRELAAQQQVSVNRKDQVIIPHYIEHDSHIEDDVAEEKYEKDTEVSPEVLLAERLISPGTTDLAKLVIGLGYWPIGEDD